MLLSRDSSPKPEDISIQPEAEADESKVVILDPSLDQVATQPAITAPEEDYKPIPSQFTEHSSVPPDYFSGVSDSVMRRESKPKEEPKPKPVPETNETRSVEFEPIAARPSGRAYLLQYFGAAIGVWLSFFPAKMMNMISPQILASLDEATKDTVLLGMFGIGIIVAVYNMGKVAVVLLMNKYTVTSKHLKTEILIFDKKSITLDDVQSMEIKRSLIDRILRIGDLEFAVAGTGGVDMVFKVSTTPIGYMT